MSVSETKILVACLVGFLVIVSTMYIVGYIRGWALPGMATLHGWFSKSTPAASSEEFAVGRSCNYCPEGFDLQPGEPYTCKLKTNYWKYNPKRCGSTPRFSGNSFFDKQAWASKCGATWVNSCPNDPPASLTNYPPLPAYSLPPYFSKCKGYKMDLCCGQTKHFDGSGGETHYISAGAKATQTGGGALCCDSGATCQHDAQTKCYADSGATCTLCKGNSC